MKKNILILLAFALLLISSRDLKAVYFEHLNMKNGLSHFTIHSLYQDEHGMVWVGTRDGLNRYDGNEITVFKELLNDSTALFANNIRNICGDKNGHLFLKCGPSLVSFDLKTEKTTVLRKHGVLGIYYGKEKLWFSANDSVFSYNPLGETGVTLHLKLPDKSSQATSILETNERILYAATNNGEVIAFDRNQKIAKKWNISDVIYLYEDSKKNIWACTRLNGLYKIDFSGNLVNYRHNPSNPFSIPDNFVRTICEDDFGNYWIGLFKGLAKFNLDKESFSLIEYEKQVQHGISNSSVWTIINDKQGTIWVGTYNGGINLYNPKYSIFNFHGAYNTPNSLNGQVIGRIMEDKKGNLWIGADGGGLNYFDRNNGTFKSYQATDKANSLSINYIKTTWLDEKRNTLWIGTHMGGLNKLNLQTGKFTVFLHNSGNKTSIPDNSVREIVHRNDTLYFATGSNIGVFDLKTESCTTMQFDKIIQQKRDIPDLILDSNDRLWFSSSNQVLFLNMKTKKFSKFKTQNYVQLFYEDSKKRMLMGTNGDGILMFNEKKQVIEPYREFNKHLPSKYIVDIKESSGGYYYVSTNAGLVIVDTELKTSQILNSSNGFPLEALNENSLHITDKNEVFVGGINGMVSFFEKDLNIPRVDYSVNITGIRVNNKKVSPGKKSIISASLPYLDEIVLKPKHSVITIFFATTNYINILKTDIEYQLVGFDKNWNDANYQQNITYTNLNPGTYTLRLRGKNKTDDGFYPEKTITIRVLPPFYKTKFAYLLYVIIILTITIIIFRFYYSKIQLSTSLEYEKREKKHIEELNQSKLRFFTNISHEFRTPLTLIINQIEVILQMGHVPQSIYGKLLNVMKNANRMKKLITELIDFRKYEQGYLKLKVSENELIPFLNEIFLSFKELAQSKDINYTFEFKQPDIKLWFDVNQMEKVFYNLLSNAFKYTQANGHITIRVEEEDYNVLVYVIDDGVGIDEGSLDQIFERFYQVDNDAQEMTTRQGSGIGLALAKGIVNLHHGKMGVKSEPNNGSKFWVKLPLGDNFFSPDQRISSHDKDLEAITDLSVPDKQFIDDILTSQKEVQSHNSSILIIEDNDELLSLLAQLFEPIYKVITAVDGVDGFEKAVKHQPDIILSDVMMPKMSGVDMCSKLKSNFETSHIPIVLLTAQSAADYIVQGLLTGADDYIIKPFNQKVLITRCNNLVNTRKQLQKRYVRQLDLDPLIIATNSIDQQLIERATALVEKNIDNTTFDINLFASEMCLSRTNLFNKIKGVTGQTPNDFIMNIKLKKSVYYLLNMPDMSIGDIAVNVGFNSTSYYIKKFNDLYGATPAMYRKQQGESYS
ncbi:MAG: two-component regulator propeller domain-containing protein [Paludibacter sp.]|nr:two-component regulator propeller domain-containing protein [Paludibacter sp.]